jgi:vacuolar-type H+-ATPase subunit E/Vma4
MTTDISPLTTVQEKIKGRIRSEFVDLIPDEMWAAMVQSVVNDFTREKVSPYDRNKTEPSPLAAMIRSEIEAICKEKIAEELRKHQASWDGYGQRTVSEATAEMIRDHTPAMLAAMQAGMTQMMVQGAIQSLRNSIGQY